MKGEPTVKVDVGPTVKGKSRVKIELKDEEGEERTRTSRKRKSF